MADVLIVDCTTGKETRRPSTAAEAADRAALATEDQARTQTAAQRTARRDAAVVKLSAIAAKAAPSPADTKYLAGVLAKVLPFIDLDPG